MATKPAQKTAKKSEKIGPAKELRPKAGDIVIFKGYSELDEGQEPILSDDSAVRVVKVKGDQITVQAIAAEDGEDPAADTVFVEELRAPTDDEREEAEAVLAHEDGDEEEESEDDEESDEDDSEDEDEEEEEDSDDDSEEEEEEAPDFAALMKLAKVADKKKAKEQTEIEEAAEAAGIDPNDYATWAQVVDTIEAAYTDEEESDEDDSEEEEDEEEEAPAKSKSKKGAKPAKDEEEEEEEEEEELVLTKSVQGAIRRHKNNAVEAAHEALAKVSSHYFDFGGLLSYIHANNIHATLLDDEGNPRYDESKNGFRQFVSEEFGIEYKSAYDYMAVYRKFTALGKSAEDFALVGISKARLLTGEEVTSENVDELLEYAGENTRDDLATYLDDNYGEEDSGGDGPAKKREAGERVERVKKTFSLFKDQAALVDEALASACADIGKDDLNAGLVQIVTEWSESKGAEVPMKDAKKAFEARYNVTLTIEKNKKAAPEKTPAKKAAPAKAATPAKKVARKK